jgi:hypothetical protein
MQHTHENRKSKSDRNDDEIRAISTTMHKNFQGFRSHRHDIADNKEHHSTQDIRQRYAACVIKSEGQSRSSTTLAARHGALTINMLQKRQKAMNSE